MPFIITNTDNSIEDITAVNEVGGTEVQADVLKVIHGKPFGFHVYDFKDGVVTLNTTRFDKLDLVVQKEKAVKAAIKDELESIARSNVQGKITAIENATNLTALKQIT